MEPVDAGRKGRRECGMEGYNDGWRGEETPARQEEMQTDSANSRTALFFSPLAVVAFFGVTGEVRGAKRK